MSGLRSCHSDSAPYHDPVDDVHFLGKTIRNDRLGSDFAGSAADVVGVCVIITWSLWPVPVQSYVPPASIALIEPH